MYKFIKLYRIQVDGGAFLLTSANFNLVLRRCVFVGNSALNSGGAIYSSIATSNLLFDSCRWEHNKCSLFGGAIYLGDSHFGVVMRNSVMNFNSADSGMVETLLVTWLFIGWG